ncbi:uncharacterized protein BCR38DRAFT_127269 [Pseudomassariella vexata]|uniref:Secreted protein n=1 Tax=Pseudomassariella vexata TaxID=1141098 RepID=A0A1Y2D725_9PEZI|nr:uncharacterized protein BCR38DRAFT_127269 [Pseudomassariella vexata]ORY55091.1 hypothetical protein BCR38DRAFT_127269 [Pseudomassariella vexata]
MRFFWSRPRFQLSSFFFLALSTMSPHCSAFCTNRRPKPYQPFPSPLSRAAWLVVLLCGNKVKKDENNPSNPHHLLLSFISIMRPIHIHSRCLSYMPRKCPAVCRDIMKSMSGEEKKPKKNRGFPEKNEFETS